MLSLLLAVRRLFKAVRYAWQDATFRVLALVTTSVLTAGTIFYHLVEGWRWLDSLYFCVITLATIGFGDFTPKTDLGKIFTIVYVFIGIGLLVAVFTRLADALLAAQHEQIRKRENKQ
jgi:voltage-gated potassium channel